MQLYGMAIFAQTKIVTGQVIDVTNSPLPGVNILVKGTTIGCITDIDGNYSISVPDLADRHSCIFIHRVYSERSSLQRTAKNKCNFD